MQILICLSLVPEREIMSCALYFRGSEFQKVWLKTGEMKLFETDEVRQADENIVECGPCRHRIV